MAFTSEWRNTFAGFRNAIWVCLYISVEERPKRDSIENYMTEVLGEKIL
jgi:hypothetical protein